MRRGSLRPTSSSGHCSNRVACSSPAHRRHPGKFGFVSLHNLLASGYAGGVFGTNLKGEEVLGIKTVADIADLPDGAIDLVFVCTPASANPDLLARLRRQGGSSGVPHVGRLRRGGGGGPRCRTRPRRPGRRARHPARRAERPGRGQHTGQPVRADRRAVPAGGQHRCRQPERQLRLELPQPVADCRASASAEPCRRATPLRSRWPTTSTGMPRRRHHGRAGLRRRHQRRARR